MENISIGFIGFGNMAQAIVEGLLLKNVLKPEQIYVCAKNWDKLCKNADNYGVCACKTSREVAEHAEIVVVALFWKF